MKTNIDALLACGISYEDAIRLRKDSLILHRWHELECGDGNDYASWSVERDEATGKPYRVVYPHNAAKSYRERIADRETAALKRIKAVMSRYPGYSAYVQGDPRGCALYILRPGDVPEGKGADAYYNCGVAVF